MSDFLSRVRESSNRAVQAGKDEAIRHAMSIGVSRDQAESLYETARQSYSEAGPMVVVNSTPEGIKDFLRGSPLRNTDSGEFQQARRALGLKEMPLVGLLTDKPEGNRAAGEWSVVLSGIENDVVVLNGDLGRIRNPTRNDFREDPRDVLCSWADAAACRASSAMRCLQSHELSGSTEEALAFLGDREVDYGPCHVLIMRDVGLEDVSRLIVPSEENLREARGVLDDMGRLASVSVSKKTIRLRVPEWQHEETDTPPAQNPQPMYLSEGDDVALKPTPGNPAAEGMIVDISSGKVTVEWEGGRRTIFDLSEALARLMPAPKSSPLVLGDVSYSLPGMDGKTFAILTALDLDPVNVVSVASTHTSPCEEVPVEEDSFVDAMEDLGVSGEFVDGFVPGKHDIAFVPGRWFEASLPYGERLIVDLSKPQPRVVAGSAEDYLLLPEFTQVPAE